MSELVNKHIARLNVYSARGNDGTPPAFIKRATLEYIDDKGKKQTRNVLAPTLTLLFHKAISTNTIPEAWKEARITPLYKKGPVSDPESYRLLAVNSITYRLFANVMRDLVTEWCIQAKKFTRAYDCIDRSALCTPPQEFNKVAHSAPFCLPFSSMISALGRVSVSMSQALKARLLISTSQISSMLMNYFSQPRLENLYRICSMLSYFTAILKA